MGGLKLISEHKSFHETNLGRIIHGNCLDVLTEFGDHSVNLIMLDGLIDLLAEGDLIKLLQDGLVEPLAPLVCGDLTLVLVCSMSLMAGYRRMGRALVDSG